MLRNGSGKRSGCAAGLTISFGAPPCKQLAPAINWPRSTFWGLHYACHQRTRQERLSTTVAYGSPIGSHLPLNQIATTGECDRPGTRIRTARGARLANRSKDEPPPHQQP